MGCGKACAQAAHAAQLALFQAKKESQCAVDEWVKGGYHKIVLAVDSEAELTALFEVAVARCLPASIIVDFGLTQLPPHTITAVGIGPARSEDINQVTGHLKLY
jgi:PTH2 family peptidyl-tRNA hydrolase